VSDICDLKESIEQLRDLLSKGHHTWLLGAGASHASHIPLIAKMTELVVSKVSDDPMGKKVISAITSALGGQANIEVVLSQIGDYLALARRANSRTVAITPDVLVSLDELMAVYRMAVSEIADLVTFGYDSSNNTRGTPDEPMISTGHHQAFFHSLLKQIHQDSKKSGINFVTTNYDTLIEDSLNMIGQRTVDGFVGGAVGYWSPADELNAKPTFNHHKVVKLHGSADWFEMPNGKVVRRRGNIKDLKSLERVVIYPQSTKYTVTQRDPFIQMFRRFRELLQEEHHVAPVLFTCGYSWSDEHINEEIKSSFTHFESQLHVVSFSQTLPDYLRDILSDGDITKSVKNRLIVATENGCHCGSANLTHPSSTGVKLDWWKFIELGRFIAGGNPHV